MIRLLSLLAFLLASASTPAIAASNNAVALKGLRTAQASIYAVVREFHMQTTAADDPSHSAQLKATLGQAATALQSVKPNGNAALDAALKDVQAAWPGFAKLAASNNIAKDGYTDDNLIGDLYTAAEGLDATLNRAIKAVPAGSQRALADRVHTTNMLLQRTVAHYLKRGAQMSPDVGAEDSFDIGKATATLDREIGGYAKELKSDPAMPGVYAKWNFIRGSLVNYNDSAVPFIVDRYATQMNTGFLAMTGDLDTK